MEPLSANDITAPAPPQTPKPKQDHGPPVVESTPMSRRCTTHAEDEVPKRADVVNKFLEDDISDRLEVSLDDFATLILDLPADWQIRDDFTLLPDSEAVKDAFAAYLKVAIGEVDGENQKRKGMAGHESGLYQPLANLLNSLRDGEGRRVGKDIDEKIFYVQDPRPVLGSLIARKPDLGGIYVELLKLTKNKKLSDYLAKKKIVGIFWGLLLYFIEVKHEQGRFVGLNVNKEGPSSRSQSDSLPSIAYLVSQSTASVPASTPLNSTSTSFGDEHRPGVTIQNRGGKKKTVEILTSQDYQERAEAERKAEKVLTPTQGQHLTRIQCASYAKEMLSKGFIRSHAVGITADDTSLRFQYYHRSKVVESKPFNIVNDEVKKLFMAMVCQLNKLSTENLGFIPNLDLDGFDHLRNPKQLKLPHKNGIDPLVGSTYAFTGSDGRRRRVKITKVLYRAEGIIGRCSIVVEVECLCTEAGCDWHEEGQATTKVMKISFPNMTRPSEDGLIGEARSTAESSGDFWALNHLPEVIDSITFPYHEETTVQGRLKKHLKDDYEERVMRVTFLDKLQPLSDLEDPREFAQVFYDVLQIHQWLYERVGILHRDLSSGNIMYRRKNGKVYGVLNDFDLSSRVQDMNKGPTSKQRTGTRPFMSLDLLNPDWEGGHLYRHDLESLFYIMLCLACRYEAPGVPSPDPRPYSEWFSGTDAEVLSNKSKFLLNALSKGLPVQPYFSSFKQWLWKIFKGLRLGYTLRPLAYSNPPASETDSKAWNLGDDDDEDSDSDSKFNYEWTTLNKRVSYAKIRSIMSSFKGQPLETRWVGNPDH
ncbi:protein kinase [Lentinula edodes]|uniref:protein kinase n=1 Tax=Lentinula edodes TaxID=5353 RepID=UPI001E8D4EA3|nr:protein kinase [Lentinula edodes]KAH7880931.1 protein kinase [Lentinula edodes]